MPADNNYPTYGTVYAVQERVNNAIISDELENELKKKLKIIFPYEEASKINNLVGKIKNSFSDIPQYDTIEFNEFINGYINGEFQKIDELFVYLKHNDFDVTTENFKEFYNIIHKYIIGVLTPLECRFYISRTFPLWSKLKRMLLEERPGGTQKQWEYAVEKYKHQNKRDELSNGFNRSQHYKQIKNKYAFDAICKLVDTAVFEGDTKFKNTINGWFPKGLKKPPGHHSIQRDTLYKLAYGFALSPVLMDRLGVGAVNGTRNPFDFEDNMYRFGLNYNVEYKDISKIISNNEDNIQLEVRTISNDNFLTEYDQAISKLDSFFESHQTTNIHTAPQILSDYLELLNSIGSCEIEGIRKEVAKECLGNIIKKTDIKIIKKYYNDNDVDINLTDEFYPSPQKSKVLRARMNSDFSEKRENVRELKNLQININKSKYIALSYLFDGKGFDAEGQKNDNPNIVTGYRNIIKSKLKITRPIILRLGYISTIVDLVNGTTFDDELLDKFEEKTNIMLKKCLFHELYYVFPDDIQMYLALSCKKYFKPDFYQAITS